jgi:hypothetical protein
VSWEFGLLGPVLVLRDGKPVRMARGGQQAMLAALLLKAGRLAALVHDDGEGADAGGERRPVPGRRRGSHPGWACRRRRAGQAWS